MEKTNLLTLVVTLTVGIILAGSLLMPVISDATETETTFTNEGYYRMSEFSTTTTIKWDVSAPTTLAINGTAYDVVELLPVKNMYFTFFANDGAYMRVAINSLDHMIIQCQDNTGTALLAMDSSSSGYSKVLITIDEDSVVLELTPTLGDIATISEAYSEWCYVFDANGYYTMKFSNSAAYVVDQDIIVLAGVTNVGETPVGVYGHGTLDNLTIISGYPDDDTTYSNIQVNSTAVSGYNGLNKLENITFDMTREDTTVSATYSYYLVPYEVTAELTNHLTPEQISLMVAIPVIVIIGLVLAGVGAIFVRNRD